MFKSVDQIANDMNETKDYVETWNQFYGLKELVGLWHLQFQLNASYIIKIDELGL